MGKLIDQLINWAKGVDRFTIGQRVILVAGYPSDIADSAHRGVVMGTVTRKVKGHLIVVWDGFPCGRYMQPSNLKPIQ